MNENDLQKQAKIGQPVSSTNNKQFEEKPSKKVLMPEKLALANKLLAGVKIPELPPLK